MNPAAPPLSPLPSAEDLALLRSWFEADRQLDAFARCRTLAPLAQWSGVEALVLAGRFAAQWGDQALSQRLHHRAYREQPDHPLAIYYESCRRSDRHGDWAALDFLNRARAHRTDTAPPLTPADAHLIGRRARLLAGFRDFSAARPELARALEHFPEDAWLHVEAALLHERQDDYDQALVANARALELRPWYRPAVLHRAHLLQLVNREDEAIALLRAALDHLQSGYTVRALIGLHEDRAELDALPALLELAEQRLPLADPSDRRWLAARRCMAAHLAGDRPQAIHWARENGTFYFQRMATHLESAPVEARRVQLPVEFVRQHHMTCAPATLAALTAYWQRPVPHLEIADAICYDGSLDHAERNWAESHGWRVREFRPTWDATRALLDRGCPFSLVTVAAESAHMQAVIGYDDALGTVIVRDPFQRRLSEWLAPEFLTTHAAHGPRALVLVPGDRPDLLADLELPDAALYDEVHRFRRHLHFHRHAEATAALAALVALDPAHLLTQWARYDLAIYDGRLHDALPAVQAIRAHHPQDDNWRLTELSLLKRLDDPRAHRTLLTELGAPRCALSAIRRDYAEELGRDARHQPRVRRLLISLLRREAGSAANLRALANLQWSTRDHAAALELYRLAACCAEKTEYHWSSYFIASRHLGRTEEALTLLRERVARFGARSTLPVRTLFNSLAALNRTAEGHAALAAAQALAPEDGDLLLFRAQALARVGQQAEARRLLETAQPLTRRPAWLRTAADLADFGRDHAAALAHWQDLTAINPHDQDAHEAVVRLLEVTAGAARATAHLAEVCAAHPHLIALRQTLVRRLKHDERLDEALATTAAILAPDPRDDWTLRERALLLARLGRRDEALATAAEALQIAPHAVASHTVRAGILRQLGRPTEAHACYRHAVTLSIDATWVFDPLLETCANTAERRASIEFLHAELTRQNSLEGASLQFRLVARTILSVDELTGILRAYHAARPGNWDAWCALGTHLREAGDLSGALALAREATDRFPLLPRVWTDLAEVNAALGDAEAQIAHLVKALEINPSWSRAARQLSAAYESRHQLEESAAVLRRAVQHEPLESVNHGFLADVEWRLGHRDAAIAALETALDLNLDYSWAWDRLESWSTEQGEPNRARDLARRFTTSHAGQASAWLQSVRRSLDEPDPTDLLVALDHAARLAPDSIEPWDLRAQLLTRHRRYDEALAACAPAAWPGKPPAELRGRAAWIDYKRGRRREATDALKAVLAAAPDFLWGWRLLTEWSWEAKDWSTSTEAAQRWAWLAPDSALPHGHLAAAHAETGQPEAQLEALTRAIALDPQYDYALNELFALHLAKQQPAQAEALLTHYDTHYLPAEGQLARARLALHNRDRRTLREQLRALALGPASALGHFNRAVKLTHNVHWDDQIERVLADLLDDQRAQSSVAEHWVEARLNQHKLWRTVWRASHLQLKPKPRDALLDATLTALGQRKLHYPVRFFRWLNQHRLRRSDAGWSATIFALSRCSLFRAVVTWAHDWEHREPPAQPWTLFNLTIALQTVGHHARAVAAMDQALAQPPDHTRDKLLAWRAHEHLLQGQTAAARDQLAQVNSTDWTPFFKSIETLATVLRDVQTAPPDQRTTAGRLALRQLRERTAEHPGMRTEAGLRRAHRRTLQRLGRDTERRWLRWCSRLSLRLANPDPREVHQALVLLGVIAAVGAYLAFLIASG